MFPCNSGSFGLNSLKLDQSRSSGFHSSVPEQFYWCFFKVLPSYFLQKMITLTSVTISSLFVTLWLVSSSVLPHKSPFCLFCSVQCGAHADASVFFGLQVFGLFHSQKHPSRTVKSFFVGIILSQSVISYIGLIFSGDVGYFIRWISVTELYFF